MTSHKSSDKSKQKHRSNSSSSNNWRIQMPTGAVVRRFCFGDYDGEGAKVTELPQKFVSYSWFIKPGLDLALQKIYDHYGTMNDIFIACPTYWKASCSMTDDDVVDMQFAVTGKKFKHEGTIAAAMMREFAEETGSAPRKMELICQLRSNKGDSYTTYVTYADQVCAHDPERDFFRVSPDVRNSRCQGVLAGREDELVNLIESVTHRASSLTEAERKELRGVSILPLRMAIEHVEAEGCK